MPVHLRLHGFGNSGRDGIKGVLHCRGSAPSQEPDRAGADPTSQMSSGNGLLHDRIPPIDGLRDRSTGDSSISTRDPARPALREGVRDRRRAARQQTFRIMSRAPFLRSTVWHVSVIGPGSKCVWIVVPGEDGGSLCLSVALRPWKRMLIPSYVGIDLGCW